MSKKEIPQIPEILEAAQTFAHDFHTRKLFDEFTEAEVMQGVAALSIALHHFVKLGIKFETTEESQLFFDTLEAAGLDVNDDSWGRSGEVFEIMAKILCAGKGGAAE